LARLSKLFSFRQFQAARPNSPLPGTDLDNEFTEVRKVVNEIDAELKDIRRSDGALNNGIVTQDSLAPGLLSQLTDPINQAVANARTSGAASAQIATDAANNALANAQEAQTYAQQAHLAADSVTQNIPGALSDINSAKAAALQAALDAKNAAADISNAEKSAAADADLAHKYAELSELWAEWMGQDGRHDQTIPPNKLKEMGITGDHWSARWWANKAANAFGQLTGLYLGVHPDHGSATASAGGPLTTGAIYYNSTTQTAYIWDGNGWKEFLKPSRAFTATLVYDATALQSVFDITTPDKFSRTATRTSTEAVDVFLNGVRLVPTDDYSVVGNVVTLNQAAPLHSMVQIDVYRDPNSLAPGAMNARLIRGITPDGVQTVFVATRQDTGQPIAAASPAELLVSVDGVIQEPGVDYQVNVKDVQFTKAPSADSNVFMVWYEPASAAGATRVIPAGTRLDALLDVMASGAKAAKDGQSLVWDDTDKRWEPKSLTTALSGLTDTKVVGTGAPKKGEVLTWDDVTSKWVSRPPTGGKSNLVDLLDVDAKNTHVPRDKDVLAYDQTAKMWSPSKALPDATVKALASDADPDPTKLPAGYLVLTTENNKHRLSVVSATGTLITLFDDVDLNQRIAANSLFQGAVKTPGELTALPTPANTNRGFYWTWQGSSGFVIAGSGATGSIIDPTVGLSTVTLNTGDWLQSDGTKWVHVSADLLSKQRWMTLGGFVTWAASTYEQGALVIHRASASSPLHYYRATGAVSATDPAPGRAGAPWEDITPQASIRGASDYDNTVTPLPGDVIGWDGGKFAIQTPITTLAGLTDVDQTNAASTDEILIYDGTQWTPVGFALSNLTDVTLGTPPRDGQVLIWNTDHWEAGSAASSIATLTDVDLTTRAQADGDALVWDATSGKWMPQVQSTSHPFLGSLASRPTAVNVGDTYYQTAAQTITTTTPGTAPAGIVAPTPTYDPLMNTPLAAGAVPDPASPGNPWRNPAVVPLPSTEPKYRFIYNGVTYQVDGAAPLIARINAGQATPDLWAQGANPPISVSTGTAATTTTTNVDVGFYRWDGTTWQTIKTSDYIPLFKGTFSVGSNTGSGYVPPTTPAEGDIWVDKNSTPPVFKVYRNGAWVLVNWQTDHLGLLSDLANVNVGASGSPGQGDALVFNQLTEQWESGAVPAHLTEYDRNTNYSAGTTVYYKGGLFEAKTRTSGVSPDFQYGDVWFFHRSNFAGTGDYIGPISFEAVNIVADATVAPTLTYAPDDIRPHWTLQYTNDNNWAIWQWELSMRGWTPGSALPVATWHRYDTLFTKPTGRRLWRNYSSPTNHVGDVVVWIYDDPKGTNAPHYRLFPWTLRPIRGDLISMHDVKAENPADQSILIWDDATSYWLAKPNPSYTKAEVDTKVQTLIQGLSHETAVQAIQNNPPSAPVSDEFYIVGTAGTGAWAGHNNAIAWWDGAAWQFQTPQTGETRLVETAGTGGENWHWNGTAWVKVANATTGSSSAASLFTVGDIKQSILTETQFIAELGVVEGRKWVLADGRNVAGTRYATLTNSVTVPDLRGAYLRMAGQNSTNASWNGGALNSYQEDMTRAPRNTAFTTDSQGNHQHANGAASWGGDAIWYGSRTMPNNKRVSNWDDWSGANPLTSSDGAHTHTITGGDSETKPKSYTTNFFIKVD